MSLLAGFFLDYYFGSIREGLSGEVGIANHHLPHHHARSELGTLQGQVSLEGPFCYMSDAVVRGGEEMALFRNLESLVLNGD